MRPILTIAAAFLISWAVTARAADWQKDWADTLAAAKKEGTVVVVGSPDPVMRNEIIPRFQKTHGITVEFIAGSSGPIIARVRTERSSGIYSTDVYLTGSSTTVTVMYPEKLIDPLRPMLILPEVTEGKYWKRGEPWFMDPEKQYIMVLFASIDGLLMINTDYVKRDEMRTTKDLLDPKWQGKIVSEDPAGTGSGSNTAVYFFIQRGADYIKQLYFGQKVMISRDRRQMTDWLARGTYPICLTCRIDDTAKLREEGFKIEEVFKLDDLPNRMNNAPLVMTVANKPPHPNAAKVFVNWMAGKEALETYSRGYNAATTRTDADESFLDPKIVPKPGMEYVDETNFEWLAEGRPKAADQIRKMMKQQ